MFYLFKRVLLWFLFMIKRIFNNYYFILCGLRVIRDRGWKKREIFWMQSAKSLVTSIKRGNNIWLKRHIRFSPVRQRERVKCLEKSLEIRQNCVTQYTHAKHGNRATHVLTRHSFCSVVSDIWPWPRCAPEVPVSIVIDKQCFTTGQVFAQTSIGADNDAFRPHIRRLPN